jgi:RNA polymerase sigma-70 factor, ECF subfamily
MGYNRGGVQKTCRAGTIGGKKGRRAMSNAVYLPDDQVIQATLAGRCDAFGVLVERYLSSVHAVAYAQLGSRAEAEDVAQETFLAAYQSLDKLRERGHFAAWLMGIARNMCHRARRRQGRQDRLATRARDTIPTAVKPDMARQELHELLRSQVMGLDEAQREVLLLHYFGGKKIAEIADMLGVSFDAAAKRLQRAREALGVRMVDELCPAVAPEETEEERKKRIMAAILVLPVPWRVAEPARPVPGWPIVAAALRRPLVAGLVAVVAVGGGWVALRGGSHYASPTESAADSAPAQITRQGASKAAPLSAPPAVKVLDGPHTVRGTVPGLASGGSVMVLWGDVALDRGIEGVPAAVRGLVVATVTAGPGGSFRVEGLHTGRYTLLAFTTVTGKMATKGPPPRRALAAHVDLGGNRTEVVALRPL